MSTVRAVHDRAMALAEKLISARTDGAADEHLTAIAKEAFAAELEAATLAFDRATSPATRLILLRSAAHLAREAREWTSGLDLAIRALGDETLRDHRTELLRILDTLRTYEHLEVTGVQLSDTEVQLSIAGSEAAPGFARAEEVTRRVNNVRKLLIRNNMRRLGQPFDAAAPKSRVFREAFTPYLSLPRAASYAITMRFGVNEQTELNLPGGEVTPPPSVAASIDDLVKAAKDYAKGGLGALRESIKDENYARATASLLRDLSPDNKRIQTVGLTVFRNGRADPIALPARGAFDPPRVSRMPSVADGQALPPVEVEVRGRLLEGSAKKPQRAHATIVEDSGNEIVIHYDEATHGDVIDGYWKHVVSARIRRFKREQWFLIDIEDA